jgi:hypothetical protein
MATRNGSSAAEKPTAEAREALAMWGLALRYASAAVKPVAKGATQGVKNSVKDRLSAATSSETSVKDRINPSSTEKGGKVGDAADALLAKMGKPGKLASKVSLGSRVVGRLAPGTTEEPDEQEPTAESEETVEEPDEAADREEAVEEPEAAGSEDDDPEASAESEPSGSDAEDEDEEAEDDDPDESAAKSDATDGHLKEVKPHSEPVRAHPGADPLHTDFDHAYSEEVENYEHRDAYATTR